MKKKCCDLLLSDKEIKDILQRSNMNRTKIKVKTLQILAKSKAPISAVEIFEKIGADFCDISSIWRTLKQFHQNGLIREINLGEGFFRYEIKNLTGDESHHHHHHVRCRQCGSIRDLELCDLVIFDKLIKKIGFKDIEHHLEFTGICPKCNS